MCKASKKYRQILNGFSETSFYSVRGLGKTRLTQLSHSGTPVKEWPSSCSKSSRALRTPGRLGFPQSWSIRNPPGFSRGQKYRRPSRVTV